MNKRHNKKRNPALLYEFLIRHASRCLVEGKQEDAYKASQICKKFFSEGKPLNKELKLFKSVLNSNVKSHHSAQKLLDSVCESAKESNVRNLDVEKSKLIKEINYTFDNSNFYNYKIPNYVVYASLQTLLSEARNKKKVLSEVKKIQLEDVVSEHLLNKTEQNSKFKLNPQYNNVVYKFALKKFHEKYANKLNEDQKSFLTKYTTYLISKDKTAMKETLLKESEEIKDKLLKCKKDSDIQKDTSLVDKINECYKRFVSIDFNKVNEKNVLEVLNYMQLVAEVES